MNWRRLQSPEYLIHIFCTMACVGLPCGLLGRAIGSTSLKIMGLVLMTPLLISTVIITLVVIPILIAANRRYGHD